MLAGHKKDTSRIQLELIPTDSDQNYTPIDFVSPCRSFLGGFDLDPFSCDFANLTIEATTYWTKADDAFLQDWTPYNRKWINPPYSRSLIAKAVAKTLENADIGETLLLTNSSTSAQWFHAAMQQCTAYLHPFRRIKFSAPGRTKTRNEYDQTLFYFGHRPIEFSHQLKHLGDAVIPFHSTFTLKALAALRSKDVLGDTAIPQIYPLEHDLHDRIAELEAKRDHILRSGPIAPAGVWIEYGRVSGRKFRQAYFRSVLPIFTSKRSGNCKRQYIGAEGSKEVKQASDTIARRNALQRIEKEIKTIHGKLT